MNPDTYQVISASKHWIIVDKPAEWLTTPSREGAKDTRSVLGLRLQEDLATQVFPVHRLDYEVSGLVLFALSADCHRDCNLAFGEREVGKTYEAFAPCPTVGSGLMVPQGELKWQSHLLRGKRRTYERPFGKPSETLALCLGAEQVLDGNILRWRLCPLTGRPHQLRFEMAKHGFPILGDTLYGSMNSWPHPGIALRAIKVEWPKELQSKWGLPSRSQVPGLIFGGTTPCSIK